ncbi:DUF2946 domain-containing protein [Caballeronia sp. ATUFL_M2_KS44]|uniref:DUF2946 domain-containing protein n=1 Tax=Caballeronia sp. ATUFL_M2_KS44 TaxID=2921767 RepID=UPI002027831F|nr:DUF2946 domain-containing protein [Caballeronia sp. ATUFL_M2_KS44]
MSRVSGIVALCAMLMLSLAPAASQWLNAKRIDALASVCASGIERTAPSSHADDHALPHLAACGYCDLLAHAPTPPIFPQAFASIHMRRASFSAIDAASAEHRIRFDDAQPRAPPALA